MMSDSHQTSGATLYPVDSSSARGPSQAGAGPGADLESTPSYSSNGGSGARQGLTVDTTTESGNAANPKKGPRPSTGRSSSIRVEEGDVTAEHARNNGAEQHGGFSEKLNGLRQRAINRGHHSSNVRKSAIVEQAQKKEYKTGLIGFAQRVGTGLSEPRPKVRQEPTWRASMMAIVKASWLNVLLVFIPVSWALHFAGTNDTVVFVMSFLAIIPLAKLLGFGTEELSLRVGQTIGGLLNATLGNVVELIVAILALVKCELQIVQSSLLGSILSNVLLVLGMCFFAGGLRFSEQSFGDAGAQINSSLLLISVIAILMPAGYHAAFGGSVQEQDAVLAMSRGTAVIVLTIYIAYMVFQLWSHSHLFSDSGEEAVMKTRKLGKHTMFQEAKSVKRADAAAASPVNESLTTATDDAEEEEEEEQPSINLWSCIILLLIVAALVGVTAEWLVDSINGLVATGAISEQWVGLILLPIVGNAAEHVTAVTVSYKDKLDLSIGVAVGSSIQIALFVIPVLVLLGWALGKPLSLLFDPFESVTLFLAVLLAQSTMADARSNWLEGYLLMMVYVIIAVSFWYYPSETTAEARLLVC